MLRVIAVAVLGAMTGACAGATYPAGPVSAPAPPAALECAMREATGHGYTVAAGGKDAGYVRFTRYTGGTFTATLAGGVLHLVGTGDSRRTQQDIRNLLAVCTDPSAPIYHTGDPLGRRGERVRKRPHGGV
jgi:hypothetical protein